VTVAIRDMTASDADEVCALVLANYDCVIAAWHSPQEFARLRAVVTPAWVAGQLEWSRVFVAVDDREGILATAALADLGPTSPRRYCARQCFVRVDYHRRGLGASVMAQVCAAAREVGATRLHVPSSRNAVAFYRHLGFLVDEGESAPGDETTWMSVAL
jgi:GNAT superfamily N-acetyltransferase